MTKQGTRLFDQPLLRTIVVGGTALTLSVMLGSLALVAGRNESGFQWAWSWWSVAWFIAGWLFTASFWKAIFRAEAEPAPENKSKVVYHLLLLAALGVGAFLYPVRFLQQAHYLNIARGLFTAVLGLGTVALLLFKLGQGIFAKQLPDGAAE